MGIGCLGLTPIFEVYTGSSNTFIGGSRAARMGDVTRQCNPASAMGAFGKAMGAIGVAAGGLSAAAATAGGNAQAASLAAAQAAADATALAMAALLGKDPGGPPGMGVIAYGDFSVKIGGFPMPDTLSVLGGMVKAALKLARGVAHVGRKFAKLRKQSSVDPSEPVSVVTGAVYGSFDDVVLRGECPFLWVRHYDGRWGDGPIGRGFRHFYEKTLALHRHRAVFVDYDGVEVEFERDASTGAFAPFSLGYRIETLEDRYAVHTPKGERWVFARPRARETALRLVAAESPRCGRLELVHDGAGRIVGSRQRARDGWIETHLQYDGEGRIVAVSRGERGKPSTTLAQYRYENGCMTAFGIGGRVHAAYRWADGLMIRAQDCTGYGFTWSYDHLGRCSSARGDDGLWGARFEYDVGRTRVTEEDGGVWVYDYDEHGTIRRITDPTGGVRQFRVDALGRIDQEIDPAGRITRWLYDSTGHNHARIDPWGAMLRPLDEDPRPADSRAHRIAEDARTLQLGHLALCEPELQVPAPSAGLFRCAAPRPVLEAVDARGRVVERSDADGRRERWVYDPRGNVVGYDDPDGRRHGWTYASWNLVAGRVDPNGGTTRLAYDHRQNPTRIEDPGGHVMRYRYDLAGRVVGVVNAGELEESYVYDAAGQLLEKRGADGATLVAYEYGDRGLATRRKLASGDEHDLAYDGRGRYTRASASGFVVELEHGRSGVIRDERDGLGVRVERGGTELVLLGRFRVQVREGDHGQRTLVTPDGSEHLLLRDRAGTVLRRHASSIAQVSRHDEDGRCAARYAWLEGRPEQPIWWARYDWSAAGELRRVHDSALGTTSYVYDAAHRVIEERPSDTAPYAIHYDAAGNITRSRGYAWMRYDERNRLVEAPGERFGYDDRHRLALHVRMDGSTARHRYDSLDRLVAIDTDGAPPWRAAYDGLGRRMYKQSGEERTTYYWQGDRLAAEVFSSGCVRIYVYASDAALVPLLFLDYDGIDADPAAGRVHYVFGNQIGMPVLVLDGEARLAWAARSLGAYGDVEVREGNRIDYDLRFPGHQLDRETGLHYNRFRYYSPRLGRYLQPDPAGQLGGIHLYAYPANPLADVDVLGLCAKKPGDASDTGDAAGPQTKKPGDAGPENADADAASTPPALRDWKQEIDENGMFRIEHCTALLRQMKEENPLLGQLKAKERDPNLTPAEARRILEDAKAQLAERGMTLKIVGQDVDMADVPEAVRPEKGNWGRFDDKTDTIYLDQRAFDEHPPSKALKEVRHETGAVALAREFGGKKAIPKSGPWWLTHLLDDT
jgi:RHS repeat-associated protein